MAETKVVETAPLHAAAYASRWNWPLALGTSLVGEGCSCGDVRCPAPGAHPAHPLTLRWVSADPDRVQRWWKQCPFASIIAPTGRRFDAVRLPRKVGMRLLSEFEKSRATVGPIIANEDALTLLIRPGEGPAWRDLGGPTAYMGPDAKAFLVLPSGGNSPIRWVVPPTETNTGHLPAADEVFPVCTRILAEFTSLTSDGEAVSEIRRESGVRKHVSRQGK
jgi:hypothetical protein